MKRKRLNLSKRSKSRLEVVLPDGQTYELMDERTITPAVTMDLARLQSMDLDEEENVEQTWGTIIDIVESFVPDAPKDLIAKLTIAQIRELLDFFGSHVQSVSETGPQTSPDSSASTAAVQEIG